MENNLLTQKAGDGAHQIQAQQIIINQGITEDRARAIFIEMKEQAIATYTHDAYALADQRIKKLENIVISRLSGIDGALEHFADPAFQLVLRKAEQSAATTEREEDYEMLSDLLACHVQQFENRKSSAAISKAIDIITQIDNEALSALTISNFITNWIPVVPCCHEGLECKERVLRQSQHFMLPTHSQWIEHLEMLGAVRITSVSSKKKMFDLEKEKLNGYVCTGIKIGSMDYQRARSLLRRIDFNIDYWLQENELLKGYVRLPISKESEIERMNLIPDSKIRTFENTSSRKATNEEVKILNSIFQMYTKNKELYAEVEKQFRIQWNRHNVLCNVEHWWDNLCDPFFITQAGRLVAHTNALRLHLIE